jgi:hypothetical protein
MSYVFVLDTHKQPLTPVHPGQARRLLKASQAAVYRIQPFTIILKQAVPAPVLDPLRLKLDPGSKTTGIALVNDATGQVVWAADSSIAGQRSKRLWIGAERYGGTGATASYATALPASAIAAGQRAGCRPACKAGSRMSAPG